VQVNRGRGQPAHMFLHAEVAGRESTYHATINKSPTAKQGPKTTQALGTVSPVPVSKRTTMFTLQRCVQASTHPLICGTSSISAPRTICQRCHRRNSSATACTGQHSTARRKTESKQVTWNGTTSQFACIFLDQHTTHSFVLAGDIQFLSSPTRKKPAYLLGSTYSASYDNAMELVHGQVQYRHTTSNPGP